MMQGRCEKVLIRSATSWAATQVPLADALALGPGVWDRLLARAGVGSPFLTWAWFRAWAAAAHAADLRSCHALVLRAAMGSVEGVFPFRVERTWFWGIPVTDVGWAFGDFGAPVHLDLLAAREVDLDSLVERLDAIPWTLIRLGNVAEGAVNVQRLCAACERRGWVTQRWPAGRCLYLELPGSWETYLSSLSAHGRHAIRHKERALRRKHDVTLTDYGGLRVEEGLRHLRRLHTLRWRGGGAFGDSAWERLHQGFAAALAERGQLWLLTLDLDGEPAAAWYGFALGDTLHHYQSGRDPRWERERVGTVLMSLIIRRAIECGYRRLDFLRGEEPYKAEWTSTARPYYDVLVFRPGWRGVTLRTVDRLARSLHGRLRTVMRRSRALWSAMRGRSRS